MREKGIEISDNDRTTYSNNRSFGNSEDGFLLECDSGPGPCVTNSTVTLLKNTVKRNDGDGIDVDDVFGNKIVLDGNRVTGNRGTGIENDNNADTSLKNNFMSGNRVDRAGRGDVCDPVADMASIPDQAIDGPPAGSNTFTTGGFDVCTPGTGHE